MSSVKDFTEDVCNRRRDYSKEEERLNSPLNMTWASEGLQHTDGKGWTVTNLEHGKESEERQTWLGKASKKARVGWINYLHRILCEKTWQANDVLQGEHKERRANLVTLIWWQRDSFSLWWAMELRLTTGLKQGNSFPRLHSAKLWSMMFR